MTAQQRLDDGRGSLRRPAGASVAIADWRRPAKPGALLQQDVLKPLNDDMPTQADPRQGPGAAAVIAVPLVVLGAACLTPLAIAGFGLTRLARGRVRGLAPDSLAAGRALWRATGAAIQALTDKPRDDH